MYSRVVLFILLSVITIGCSSVKRSIIDVADEYQYHAGFYLYNPVTKKELISYNSNKYFTPASNTKVYTFYSVLKVHSDSIPAFKYVETDTALFVWGLADPSFLNYKLPQENCYSFLAHQPKIYLSKSNYTSPRLGSGWAWDDYNGDYSQEKTAFPIYGNSVFFDVDSLGSKLQIKPSIFKDSVVINQSEKYEVSRKEFSNQFEWNIGDCEDCERLRPIYFSNITTVRLLQDTLKVPIKIHNLSLPDSALTFYCIPKDSVLKEMMQESDSFMAEHLLLGVAAKLTDTLSSTIGIREMSARINEFVPDKLNWRDGSGLSRYNLFTPRSMAFLWDRIYQDIGEERLFRLISLGGKVGTLENWFKGETPYIYGKTGTLSNNFNLSGFLITKSGKRLIFSYMNNNYLVSSSNIKKEMELILKRIYEKY